jgi:hypothetical protein
MVWDGLVNASGEPFKQRVPGSIPGRLMRKVAHLPSAPFLKMQGVYRKCVPDDRSAGLFLRERDDLPRGAGA